MARTPIYHPEASRLASFVTSLPARKIPREIKEQFLGLTEEKLESLTSPLGLLYGWDTGRLTSALVTALKWKVSHTGGSRVAVVSLLVTLLVGGALLVGVHAYREGWLQLGEGSVAGSSDNSTLEGEQSNRVQKASETNVLPSDQATSGQMQGGGDASMSPTGDAVAPTTQSQAEAIFNVWLESQNESDFGRYSSLFAEDFEGIARNGSNVKKYDRKGWLDARRGAFDREVAVVAEDVKLEVVEAGVAVRFIQTWSSESYADRGEKVLELEPRNGEWKIVREIMLESKVLKR